MNLRGREIARRAALHETPRYNTAVARSHARTPNDLCVNYTQRVIYCASFSRVRYSRGSCAPLETARFRVNLRAITRMKVPRQCFTRRCDPAIRQFNHVAFSDIYLLLLWNLFTGVIARRAFNSLEKKIARWDIALPRHRVQEFVTSLYTQFALLYGHTRLIKRIAQTRLAFSEGSVLFWQIIRRLCHELTNHRRNASLYSSLYTYEESGLEYKQRKSSIMTSARLILLPHRRRRYAA